MVLASAGQIWGWRLTDIQPITDTTRSLIWGYNLILEFLAFASISRAVQVLAEYRRQAKNASGDS
jgi:hypothetical protein